MKKNIVERLGICLVMLLFCVNMGKGPESFNTGPTFRFSPLEAGEQNFKATIVDQKGNTSEVSAVNFAGKTTLGSLLQEGKSAALNFNLSLVKEIDVKNPSYLSKEYSNRSFVLADCTMNDGSIITNVLFPPHIAISAISSKPEAELVWQLPEIKKITLYKSNQGDKPA